MFNVCPGCGIYNEEKKVAPGEGWQALAVCPACGFAHPFLRLPLFLISGASGTGKTALALVCDPDTLSARLRARPAWRAAGGAEFVERMQRFNQWFLENAALSELPITLLDTSRTSVAEAAQAVKEWIGRLYG